MKGVVVSLCDLSGVSVRPWAEAGYDCYCLDIQHSIRRDRTEMAGGGSITYSWGDVRQVSPRDFPGRVAFVSAFPPCTDLAVSGARDFARKGLRRFIDALELVESCRLFAEYSGAPWYLENPVGRLSTAWRKPDYTFHPHEYGGYAGGEYDGYTKLTCLWVGGGFVMPEKRAVPAVDGSRMHLIPPGPERANLRSQTPAGFARAVFEANSRSESRRTA